ncbi:unnamed protein product [Lymnaea stagnalis]|uniref:RING-type E3 ubiquitin transferase n=1 Tax=Lymnaea stagnalis TaxID=6523 RepID=A0AAV2IBY4_LYMST
MESGRSNAKLGLRVVRGPHWRYDNQIASGLMGTVVEIDGQGGSRAPAKTVAVIWDTGDTGFYRAGYGNAYDLHIYENVQGQGGVVHEFTTCNGCHEKEIVGFRWKCVDCPAIDLCTRCYMSDKHDLAHTFIRYETRWSAGVRVLPLRCNSQNDKRLAQGIFKGAIVSRGQDWRNGNQDGGAGKTGQVVDITKWGDVFVRWMSGNVYPYRLGANGKVELKLAERCCGNIYYKSHLPVLGALGDGTVDNNCFQRVILKAVRKHNGVSKSTNQNGGNGCEVKGADVGNAGNPAPGIHRAGYTAPKNNYEAGHMTIINVASQVSALRPPPTMTPVRPPAQENLFKLGDQVKISVDYSKLLRPQDGHGCFLDSMKEVSDSPTPAQNPTPANVRPAHALGKPECIICVEKSANVAFVPCGHVACCQACSRLFGRCPICRGDVGSCLRIFVP